MEAVYGTVANVPMCYAARHVSIAVTIAATTAPEPKDHLGANLAIEGWVALSLPGIFPRVPCSSHRIARAVDVGS